MDEWYRFCRLIWLTLHIKDLEVCFVASARCYIEGITGAVEQHEEAGY